MKSNMHLICALQVCWSHDGHHWDEAPGDSQRQLPVRAQANEYTPFLWCSDRYKTCTANPDRFPEHTSRLLLDRHTDSPAPRLTWLVTNWSMFLKHQTTKWLTYIDSEHETDTQETIWTKSFKDVFDNWNEAELKYIRWKT